MRREGASLGKRRYSVVAIRDVTSQMDDFQNSSRLSDGESKDKILKIFLLRSTVNLV